MENVITMNALSRQIDGVEGVSWRGERHRNECLIQTDRWGGGSVMAWRTSSQWLPYPDRSMGWRECHGVENVIAMTALSRRFDRVGECHGVGQDQLSSPNSTPSLSWQNEGRKEIFYLTTHSTHFIYGYIASDIW